MAYGTV